MDTPHSPREISELLQGKSSYDEMVNTIDDVLINGPGGGLEKASLMLRNFASKEYHKKFITGFLDESEKAMAFNTKNGEYNFNILTEGDAIGCYESLRKARKSNVSLNQNEMESLIKIHRKLGDNTEYNNLVKTGIELFVFHEVKRKEVPIQTYNTLDGGPDEKSINIKVFNKHLAPITLDKIYQDVHKSEYTTSLIHFGLNIHGFKQDIVENISNINALFRNDFKDWTEKRIKDFKACLYDV